MDHDERSLEEIDREIQELEEKERMEAEELDQRKNAFRTWKQNKERNDLHRTLNPEFFEQHPTQFQAYASAPGWSYHHIPLNEANQEEEEEEHHEKPPVVEEEEEGEHGGGGGEHHRPISTRVRGASVESAQRPRGGSTASQSSSPQRTAGHQRQASEEIYQTPGRTFLESVGITHRHPASHHRRVGSTSSHSSQTTNAVPTPGRNRSGSTTALDEVREMAKKKGWEGDRERTTEGGVEVARAGAADVLTAMKLSAKFTAAIFGEALFVMARDWLDTTQSRPVPKSAEAEALESSLTAEALAALEKEEAGHGHEEYTKLRAAKSVKQMVEAKTADEMVKGLRNARKLKEAEALSRRVVAIRREMYGERHLATAQALNQYASVLVKHSKFDEALVAYGEALKGVREALGENKTKSKREVMILHNMAVAWVMRARQRNDEESLKKARQYGKMAWELSKHVNGPLSATTLRFERIWGGGE